MYLLVRKDLLEKYGIGKMMAHVGHNVQLAVDALRAKDPERVNAWVTDHHMTKIAVYASLPEIQRQSIACIEDVKTREIFCGATAIYTDEEATFLGLKGFELVR